MLDNNPPALLLLEEVARLVESSNSPLRDVAPRALADDGTGGAGAFVTLLRFFPNFFFPDAREPLFRFMELISWNCVARQKREMAVNNETKHSVEQAWRFLIVVQYQRHVEVYVRAKTPRPPFVEVFFAQRDFPLK